MRSIPDVAIRADPLNGIQICQQDAGGCPTNEYQGGTSLAAPEWAALAALLIQAQGKRLGSFNSLLYPLANTEGFHSAASMGSDFAHVGLGSPNLNAINRLLNKQSAGPVDTALSQVAPLADFNSAALVGRRHGRPRRRDVAKRRPGDLTGLERQYHQRQERCPHGEWRFGGDYPRRRHGHFSQRYRGPSL